MDQGFAQDTLYTLSTLMGDQSSHSKDILTKSADTPCVPVLATTPLGSASFPSPSAYLATSASLSGTATTDKLMTGPTTVGFEPLSLAFEGKTMDRDRGNGKKIQGATSSLLDDPSTACVPSPVRRAEGNGVMARCFRKQLTAFMCRSGFPGGSCAHRANGPHIFACSMAK